MLKKSFKGILVLVLAIVMMSSNLLTVAASSIQYNNTLIAQRADPCIYKHTDGMYYFTGSVPAYDRIILRRASSIQGLASAQEVTIWTKHSTGVMGAHIWAPEIHFIDGKWYIYFAAGAAENIWAIRMYVLECADADPITGRWVEKGQIQPAVDLFSLDATTFEQNGTRYLLWAMHDPSSAYESCVWIASMSNPWTLSSNPVRLTRPEYGWERAGIPVNEGPAVLKKNGKIFVTYSAADTSSNYCMGMLTADQNANLLDPNAWSKSPTPVMTSNATTGQYGTGHNSFTVAEDGTTDILVYHARPYRDISGDPLYDPNRHARVQEIYWNEDGTPNFGIPVADGITPVRFQSYNYPSRYITHYWFAAYVNPTQAGTLADSQFKVVSGLAGQGISLESINWPGYYLRHKDYKLYLEANDGSALFANDASFHQRAGLADSSAISFESVNFPGMYIRHYNFELILGRVSTNLERADATYYID